MGLIRQVLCCGCCRRPHEQKQPNKTDLDDKTDRTAQVALQPPAPDSGVRQRRLSGGSQEDTGERSVTPLRGAVKERAAAIDAAERRLRGVGSDQQEHEE